MKYWSLGLFKIKFKVLEKQSYMESFIFLLLVFGASLCQSSKL